MADFHIRSGGSNTSPYDTWAKAAVPTEAGFQAVATLVDANDKVHLVAETMDLTASAPNFINLTAFSQNWIGGYDAVDAAVQTDFSTTAFNGLTRLDMAPANSTNQGTFNLPISASSLSYEFDRFLFNKISGTNTFRVVNTTAGGSLTLRNCFMNNNSHTVFTTGSVAFAFILKNCGMSGSLRLIRASTALTLTLTVRNMSIDTTTTILSWSTSVGTLIETWTFSNFFNNSFSDPVGTGNIAVDPDYVNPGAFDFRPCLISLMKDVGDPADDFSLEPEPNGDRIDIGPHGNLETATVSPEPSNPTSFDLEIVDENVVVGKWSDDNPVSVNSSFLVTRTIDQAAADRNDGVVIVDDFVFSFRDSVRPGFVYYYNIFSFSFSAGIYAHGLRRSIKVGSVLSQTTDSVKRYLRDLMPKVYQEG